MKRLYTTLFIAIACAIVAQAQFVVTYKDGTEKTEGQKLEFSATTSADNEHQQCYAIGSTYEASNDIEGIEKITLAEPAPPAEAPNIGDYYYSDGTWSKGFPEAPEAGKQVIGIVFSTNTERMEKSDVDAGFNHGYVVAMRSAHGTVYDGRYFANCTNYALEDGLGSDVLGTLKLASSLYNRISGHADTEAIYNFYGPENIERLPAFDWTVTDFPLQAPATSTGWFLPSGGQMWDLVSNLMGKKVAAAMKGWETLNYDATYYCKYQDEDGENMIAKFNEYFSLIDDEMKEDLTPSTENREENYAELWVTTPYEEDSTFIFELGEKGLVEIMIGWAWGYPCFARPILAF